jgi:Mor family transcriptional regulator
MKALRSEFIADLASHTEEELISIGIDPDTANKKALASADAFAERWQGLHLYVAKNIKKTTQETHKQIRAEFIGNNHKQLAVTHKMHVRTIYKILKQEKSNA